MRKIKIKSAAPFYAAAGVWIIWALFLPLYLFHHFLLAAVISGLCYFFAGKIWKGKTVEIPEPEPKKTGNEELDSLISACRSASEQFRSLAGIKDHTVREHIIKLSDITKKITDEALQNPGKVSRLRKFISYYLPTTIKLISTYKELEEQEVGGENISGTMARIKESLPSIVAAFEKQLDSLFGAEALDISTDITVLENMMAREGLSKKDSDFKI